MKKNEDPTCEATRIVRYFPCAAVLVCSLLVLGQIASAETIHKVYFKGTDSQVDVFHVKGRLPGPTLLLVGGIQGDEPGGYLAADLYADISLKRGNVYLVPRANFFSIVTNQRGARGDMNRKFSLSSEKRDADARVVEIIKKLMRKSDYFLNLHDGSGFFAPRWESPVKNPMRFGQSVIADADVWKAPNGRAMRLGDIARRVIAKVNEEIDNPDHLFSFNNHRTMESDSTHKEQRASATCYAVTQVGIPGFGIETSKSIRDNSLRVHYQTIVINAFLDEFGIALENPRVYLESPRLRYLIVSVNDATPFVIHGGEALSVRKGDSIKIVHVESNYSRGLTARVKSCDDGFDHVGQRLRVDRETSIEIRKDRFLIGRVPIRFEKGAAVAVKPGIHFEPRIDYFLVSLNDKKHLLEPGEKLKVLKGDVISILDPATNLDVDSQKDLRIDLRGFQAAKSAYPLEDRGHRIDTAKDLQEKYGFVRDGETLFAVQAKLGRKVFGQCYISVVEPKMEYLVLRDSKGGTFVAYPGDRLEVPPAELIRIMDVRANVADPHPLSINMSGVSLRWRGKGGAGIAAAKLGSEDTPLDITRKGYSIGRIWLKQGARLRLFSGRGSVREKITPARF